MGAKDQLRKGRDATKSALEVARSQDSAEDRGRIEATVNRFTQLLLDVGIDGLGPLDSAVEVAEKARVEARNDRAAIRKVARSHLVGGAIGGFATGLGGFVTLPVALPANVFEFYVQAIRMVGAIAHLRGYDVKDPHVRTAILLTLVGAQADEVLKRAGIKTPGGKVADVALDQLPPPALLLVNKAIGFRLLRDLGEKAFVRLGRGVPIAGGVLGGSLDGWMMKKIAENAMKEFPKT